MKLTLGTAQLGLEYGINNTFGIPLNEEIKQIFSIAANGGIEYLDTAINYGEAEEKIGLYSGNRFKIITKLPAFPDTGYSYDWMLQTIEMSLQRLNKNKLHGLLLHRPLQLLEPGGTDFYEGLQHLKHENKVENIGISIYQPSELDILTDKFYFDIVQAPLNIFDRRLIESGWLRRLSGEGIQVHVRSVFLQGLLLVPPGKRHSKFDQWASLWSKYEVWLTQIGLTPLEACIRYVLSFPEVSNVIIGVDNAEHLKKIILASKGSIALPPNEISCDDINLINPLSWLNL